MHRLVKDVTEKTPHVLFAKPEEKFTYKVKGYEFIQNQKVKFLGVTVDRKMDSRKALK